MMKRKIKKQINNIWDDTPAKFVYTCEKCHSIIMKSDIDCNALQIMCQQCGYINDYLVVNETQKEKSLPL